MYDQVSTRMPRTVRRPLSAEAAQNLELLALQMDRSGANSRSGVRGANSDELHAQFSRRLAA